MFRHPRLILLCLFQVLFAACQVTPTVNPPPPPAPVVEHVVGYQISLLDNQSGQVTKVYRIPKANLIKEDVLNRELKFKTETGETVTFHGSWRKETIK